MTRTQVQGTKKLGIEPRTFRLPVECSSAELFQVLALLDGHPTLSWGQALLITKVHTIAYAFVVWLRKIFTEGWFVVQYSLVLRTVLLLYKATSFNVPTSR